MSEHSMSSNCAAFQRHLRVLNSTTWMLVREKSVFMSSFRMVGWVSDLLQPTLVSLESWTDLCDSAEQREAYRLIEPATAVHFDVINVPADKVLNVLLGNGTSLGDLVVVTPKSNGIHSESEEERRWHRVQKGLKNKNMIAKKLRIKSDCVQSTCTS